MADKDNEKFLPAFEIDINSIIAKLHTAAAQAAYNPTKDISGYPMINCAILNLTADAPDPEKPSKATFNDKIADGSEIDVAMIIADTLIPLSSMALTDDNPNLSVIVEDEELRNKLKVNDADTDDAKKAREETIKKLITDQKVGEARLKVLKEKFDELMGAKSLLIIDNFNAYFETFVSKKHAKKVSKDVVKNLVYLQVLIDKEPKFDFGQLSKYVTKEGKFNADSKKAWDEYNKALANPDQEKLKELIAHIMVAAKAPYTYVTGE